MAEYSNMEVAAGAQSKGLKCTIMDTVSELASKADEFLKVSDQMDTISKTWAELRRPTTVLDMLQIKEQKAFKKQMEIIQDKIAAEPDAIKKVQLTEDLDAVYAEMEESLPGLKIKNTLIDANQAYQGKSALYMGEVLDRVGKLEYEKADWESINKITGQELSADYLVGSKVDGTKLEKSLLKDYAKYGDEIKTGSKLADDYIKKGGSKAVDTLYSISTAYRKAGIMHGLPEAKFRSEYAPHLHDRFSEEAAKRLEELKKAFPELKKDDSKFRKITAFYEQQRLTDFEATDRDPRELLQIYLSAGRRKMMLEEVNQISKLALDPKMKSKLGAEYEKFREAALTIVDNVMKVEDPMEASKFLSGLKKTFYAASLFNNVGSTMNNLTTISNLTAAKYGAVNTARAIKEAGSNVYLNDILDAFGIGSSADALSVVDIVPQTGKFSDKWLEKMNVFNISEQYNIKVAAIAGMSKHYGGMDALLAKLEKVKNLPYEQKLSEWRKLAGLAKQKSMDVIFNSVHGNVSKIDSRWGGITTTLSALIKHPMREAQMLWRVMRTENPKEAAQQLGRYFFSKSMLLGRFAPYALLPTFVTSHLNEHFPTVRKDIEQVSAVLDAIALPKMAFNSVGTDVSTAQDIMWAYDVPFQIMEGKFTSPIVKQLMGMAKAGYKLGSGKGDVKDAVNVATGLAWMNPNVRGTFQIMGVPVGAAQLKKVGDAAVDFYKGETDFFGVTKEMKGGEDYIKTVVGAFAPSTPAKADTLRAKTKLVPGSYRNYLAALALTGNVDKRTFDAFVEGMGGDRKKAKQSMLGTINRMTESEKDSTLRRKGRRALNGY